MDKSVGFAIMECIRIHRGSWNIFGYIVACMSGNLPLMCSIRHVTWYVMKSLCACVFIVPGLMTCCAPGYTAVTAVDAGSIRWC